MGCFSFIADRYKKIRFPIYEKFFIYFFIIIEKSSGRSTDLFFYYLIFIYKPLRVCLIKEMPSIKNIYGFLYFFKLDKKTNQKLTILNVIICLTNY